MSASSGGPPGEALPFPERALAVRLASDRRVLAASLGAAVLMDLALRSEVLGIAGALLVTAAAAGLLASGRLVNPQARALAAAAPVFGVWLVERSSPWLIPLDVVAAGGLLILAASLASGGSVLDLSIPGGVLRLLHAAGHGTLGLAFALAPMKGLATRGRGTGAAVLRGLLLALPLVLVLGLLLASADPVFASFFRLGVDVAPAILAGHVAALAFGAWAMGGLLRLASARPPGPLPPPAERLGTTEAALVLGALVVLFGAFAAAQVVALSEGGRRVIETAGLTYAQYARSGFFELVTVAAMTLAVLLALRAATGRTTRVLLILDQTAVVLILVVVAVAVRRLDLYADVYGLTMLRLYTTLFALWIGGAFLLLGLAIAGIGRRRMWFPSAAAGLGLALLLALNVANPEALVVRRNVEHAERTGRFDPGYLAELSDDAVPALVDALPRLDPAARGAVLVMLCPPERPPAGWAAFNASRDRAYETLAAACP